MVTLSFFMVFSFRVVLVLFGTELGVISHHGR
jgi:hypothetical protein